MENNILLTDKISNLFIKFTIPSIIAMSISGAQSLIDGLFLGRYVGANALASISVAQPFISSIFGLSLIIAIGSTSLIGVEIGRGNIEKSQNIMRTTLIATLITSLIITFLGVVFNSKIAVFLGSNDVLLKDTALYIKNVSLFSIFMCFSLVFGVLTRVVGRPDLAMKANVVSLLANVLLNTLLVKYFNLGVLGASLSTAFAFASGLIISIKPFLNKNTIINVFSGRFNLHHLASLLYNGSSEGVSSLSYSITSFIFNKAFMEIAGENGVSAFTAISYLSMFATLTIDGIATGIGPIISYNYGANKKSRVKELLKLSCKITVGFGVTVFLIIILFNKNLIGLFIANEQNVMELAIEGSRIYAFSFLANGLNIVLSGYFTSIGNASVSAMVSASRGIVFIVLGILIMPKIFGINGVWFTVPFAELMTLVIAVKLYSMNKNISIYNY